MFDIRTYCVITYRTCILIVSGMIGGIPMSFSYHSCQQISLWDSANNLTSREYLFLQKSWAIPFAEKIFPAIDETPYAILYSEKNSRPNTPVNVIIGALILKDTVRAMGHQQQKTILVADGGYSGKCNSELALSNNIRLINTNLTGKPNKKYLEYRRTDEFRKYASFRNGVEAIPSLLRRKYKIDCMPVRGKLPTAFFFGCKIGAINVSKFCRWIQSSDLCTLKQG